MTTRPAGKDICELFGYEPDDLSIPAKSAQSTGYCPFLKDDCTKKNRDGVVLGVCSVVNRKRQKGKTLIHDEEVIICPNRFYTDGYKPLKMCVSDALGTSIPVYTKDEYDARKGSGSSQSPQLPYEYVVLLGHRSGKEVYLKKKNVIAVSLDWTFAHVKNNQLQTIIPAEVQSVDITMNYRDNRTAYIAGHSVAPPSVHGMNWANVWKRLIPQLIIKGNIAAMNDLCSKGTYFIVPERVYQQFEKIIGTGSLEAQTRVVRGIITILTFELGPQVGHGKIRDLIQVRKLRYKIQNIAQAFGSGANVASLGPTITQNVKKQLGL